MRDVVTRYSHVAATKKTVHNPTYIGCAPIQSVETGTQLLRSSGRFDIQQGDHHSATFYAAFDINIRPKASQLYKLSSSSCLDSHGWVYRPTVKTMSFSGSKVLAVDVLNAHVGLGGYTGYFTPRINSWIRDRTTNNLLAKCKDAEAQLGTALGEISELREMMINPFLRVITIFLRCFSKRGRKSLKKEFKHLLKNPKTDLSTPAGFWLAIQLGWLPFLNEVNGLKEAIHKSLENPDDLTVRYMANTEGENVKLLFTGYSFTGTTVQGCQSGVTARINPRDSRMWSRLGFSNPLSIAWELVGLSFVADYFVTIGKFLDLLDASFGLDFVSGYRTEYSRSNGIITNHGFNPGFAPDSGGVFPSWQVRTFAMQRVPIGGFPIARITLGKGLNTSYRKGIAAALVAVRLR